jgi:hypothetical protein
MFVPLLILAVMGLIAGLPFIAEKFSPAYEKPDHLIHLGFVTFVSIGALIVGVTAGFFLYNGKAKDPISIPLFRNRFYLDAIYEKGIVKYFQDSFAAIVHRHQRPTRRWFLPSCGNLWKHFPQSPIRQPPSLRLHLRPRRPPRHLLHSVLLKILESRVSDRLLRENSRNFLSAFIRVHPRF